MISIKDRNLYSVLFNLTFNVVFLPASICQMKSLLPPMNIFTDVLHIIWKFAHVVGTYNTHNIYIIWWALFWISYFFLLSLSRLWQETICCLETNFINTSHALKGKCAIQKVSMLYEVIISLSDILIRLYAENKLASPKAI